MLKTKRTALTLALGLLLVLFSTACVAVPAQASMSHTASAPPPSRPSKQLPQQLQAGWSGWGEVPGNGFTLSGPAPTFDQVNNYVFVRGTNNHLYVNRTSGGTTWSGWSEVPGHGLTPSAPSAATLAFNVGNDTLYLFVRGTDNKIYANTFANGTTWSGWSQVPGNGSTPDAPAAMGLTSTSVGFVELLVRGTNDRIYQNILQVG